MICKSRPVLQALFVAVVSIFFAAATASNPSAEELAIPLCSQTELVRAGTLMATNDHKKLCETTLNVKEMLRVEVEDVKKLCTAKSCLAAFMELYTTLPNCRYQDWPVKYTFKRLLMHCGVDALSLTAGSTVGDDLPAGQHDSNLDLNSTMSSSGSQDASTVGAPMTETAAHGNGSCPQSD